MTEREPGAAGTLNSDTATVEPSVWHSSAVKTMLDRQKREHVVPLPVPESEQIATDKYTEVHSCVASTARAMVDDNGRRVWDFTTDKGPLRLHSFYGAQHVKALPPEIEHLAGNRELPCNLKLFWHWKKVNGRKDVREITDIMPMPDVSVYDQRAEAFKAIAAHYGLSEFEWKTFMPRAEAELAADAPVIEYKAAYERYAKELLEVRPTKTMRQRADEAQAKVAEQAKAGQEATKDPYYATPLTSELVAERIASMPQPPKAEQPIVIKQASELDAYIPRDENNQPVEDDKVTSQVAEKPAETTAAATAAPAKPNAAPAGKAEPQNAPVIEALKEVPLVPSVLLTELKTLTGIPVTKIHAYINRKHDKVYYKEIKAKNGDDHWTDLDPVAVRKRLDKVFGFQGLGWRIIPAAGGGQVTCAPFMQTTRSGERAMYAVTMNSFVLEYALTDAAGAIRYVQTSAFSDADTNDDIGYAHRGAFTSLMKQALKMLGGFDHFMDKAA